MDASNVQSNSTNNIKLSIKSNKKNLTGMKRKMKSTKHHLFIQIFTSAKDSNYSEYNYRSFGSFLLHISSLLYQATLCMSESLHEKHPSAIYRVI